MQYIMITVNENHKFYAPLRQVDDYYVKISRKLFSDEFWILIS